MAKGEDALTAGAAVASTDGKPATVGPPQIDWWERWHDDKTWRKETSPLPGDSLPPEQVIEQGRKEWAEKRQKIIDGNVEHDAKNVQLRDDPTVAKKLKSFGSKPPRLPDANLNDADYNKAVNKTYNWWVTNANWVIRGGSSKFEPLDSFEGAHSSGEQAWAERGLTPDFYLHRIDDDAAKQILQWRKTKIPQKKETTLHRFLEYEPKKEYRDLGDAILATRSAVTTAEAKTTKTGHAFTKISGDKKATPDAIANAQVKAEQAKAEWEDLKSKLTELEGQAAHLEDLGIVCSYNGGVVVSTSTTQDFWQQQAVKHGVHPGVGSAYYACCAGPSPREGTPTTVVSYDATFSYGAGFNVSTANGWQILRDIATQEGYDPSEASALKEMWTYFKKCGIYFEPGSKLSQGPAAAYPMSVVHIEDAPDGPRGYVITNQQLVKTGVHPVWGQAHHETHGAAYEAIRHSKIMMQAFIAAGLDATLPEQTDSSATPINETLATVNFKLFYTLHQNSISFPNLIKGNALYVMLVHYMHWGPAFRVNTMLLWALARRLVIAKIDTSAGADSGAPLEAKGIDGHTDLASDTDVTNVTAFNFTPTYETDIQFARLMGPYAMKVMSGVSRAQIKGFWSDFLSDLRTLDGQTALADSHSTPTGPKGKMVANAFLESVADVKARDGVDDAVIASDYTTEKVGGTVYVLGKKRDIDAIPVFRGKAGDAALSKLRSAATPKKP